MKTFKQNDTLHGIPTKEIRWQLMEYAKKKKVPVYAGSTIESYDEFPNISFNDGALCGSSINYEASGLNLITFEQFFEYCDNWDKCKPVKVKLNDEYAAEIVDGKVKVGCQFFEFTAIEELYGKIQEAKSAK